jgi:hypothetical protein
MAPISKESNPKEQTKAVSFLSVPFTNGRETFMQGKGFTAGVQSPRWLQF